MPKFIISLALTFAVLMLLGAVTWYSAPEAVAAGTVGNGTSESCDAPLVEPALNSALGGGGLVTFNCGPALKTILLSAQKSITVTTTIEGNNLIALSGNNASRHFLVNPGVTLTLNNLILTNGNSGSGYGGSINNSVNGTVILSNTTVQNNRTDGGAIAGGAINNQGSVTLINSLVQSNTSPYAGGINSFDRLTIINSVIRGNSATAGTGGGIDVAGTTTIRGSRIYSNSAIAGGGGIDVVSGNVTVVDSSIYSNTIHLSAANLNVYGGGIRSFGALTLTNTTVSGNVIRTGAVDLTGRGGGVYASGGTVNLTSVTMHENRADIGGQFVNAGAVASLFNVTLAAHPSDASGARAFLIERESGSVTLKNSILRGFGTANCLPANGLISAGYNLSSDTSCDFLTAAGDVTNTNPLLGPLADNGGPTLTRLPLAGSQAIDNGAGCPPTDQRGAQRFGVACDKGAVEANARPGLLDLSPGSVTIGGPDFTLSVNGNGFIPGTVVLSNGQLQPATVLSSTRLQVAIPAAAISALGAVTVAARYGVAVDGLSNVLSFTVIKADQTLTFGTLPDRTFGDAPFSVTASASSGLPVSFIAAGSCTIAGSSVTLTSDGSCTITASQGGNATYNPAPSVQQSFLIAVAGPPISPTQRVFITAVSVNSETG